MLVLNCSVHYFIAMPAAAILFTIQNLFTVEGVENSQESLVDLNFVRAAFNRKI